MLLALLMISLLGILDAPNLPSLSLLELLDASAVSFEDVHGISCGLRMRGLSEEEGLDASARLSARLEASHVCWQAVPRTALFADLLSACLE